MAMTIEDYKKMYEEARKEGNAERMKAANDGANALRAQTGEKLEDASEDIASYSNKQTGTYTPINSYAAQMVNGDKFKEQVAKQQQYIDENPTAATDHTREEYRKLYGEIYDSAPYTTPADRVVPEGESGADAGLMSSGDYAVIQHLKGVWADSDEQYKAALERGDAEEAQKWLDKRDSAHLSAERIRANYGYSGGADGSMYMDYRFSGLNRDTDEDEGSGGSYGGHISGGTGGTGGTGTAGGQIEDFSQYIRDMYAAQQASALAELKAAYEKNLAELDRAEAGLDDTYRAARNQTAGASELAGRNFNEYAAANGLNSGTGGQAELARNVTLQNNLNDINVAQADSVADLQLQRANVETEYNAAIAQAQAQGDYETAAALYEEMVRVQELLLDWEIDQQKLDLQWYQAENQVRQDDESLSFQQQKYDDSQSTARQESLADTGMALLKQGVMPPAAMLTAMGMSQAAAAAYIAAIQSK